MTQMQYPPTAIARDHNKTLQKKGMGEILVGELNAANMKVYLQHSEEFNRRVR